ncbi:nitroreductase family protein [Solidesulfovibrio sp.]
MDRRTFMRTAGTLCAGLGFVGTEAALAQQSDSLPPPSLPGGRTLEEALRARQSIRSYSEQDIPGEVLSGLLWAACGVNRKETGKRTAPSAVNKQEIDVWVTKKDGAFLYEAKDHALVRKGSEDIRALTGTQSYVPTAPLDLVYVADMSKVAGKTEAEKSNLAWADTGYISQNVYLYCAVMGLGTVVRASIDVPALSKAMGLPPNQRVIMAQCVGYPKA